MDLTQLREKGVIHIGDRSKDTVLAVLMDEARPGQLSVVFGTAGVEAEGNQVRMRGGLNGRDAAAAGEFVMICHHFSAEGLFRKIDEALAKKLVGTDDSDQPWYSASFEEVIYAYPPFAKIFLSHVPRFNQEENPVDRIEGEADEEGEDEQEGFFSRMRHRRQAKEDETSNSGSLLGRTTASEFMWGMIILGIVGAAGFFGLGPADSEGHTPLQQVGKMVGLEYPEADPFDAPTLFEPDFASWYNLDREGMSFNTHALPRSHRGFAVRSWVDETGEDNRIYAAYQYGFKLPNSSLWKKYGVPNTGRLAAIMRVPETSYQIFRQVCRDGAWSVDTGDGAQGMRPYEVIVVTGEMVVDKFRVTEEACEADRPRRD